MKTIILATDFSPAAYNAAEYASDMALQIEADILLLHVFQAAVSYSDMPVLINQEDILRSAEKDIHSLKEQLILKTNNKVNIQTEVRMGGFFYELKDVCKKFKPYAVVMGSQGTTAAEHILFGAHTIYALKNLTWPLITVPPGAKFSAVKKIGLASDFDHVVETIPIDEIKMLVKDFNAELHILNIGKKDVFDADIVFESGLMQEMLMGLKPKFHFITGENTDESIMKFAERNKIDLLVVIPKRHGLFEQFIHKSHSKQLVLHSHVPVLALHHQ